MRYTRFGRMPEEDKGQEKTVGQDGFSAPVTGSRPWHAQSPQGWTPPPPEREPVRIASDSPMPVQPLHNMPMRAVRPTRSAAACGMASRRVMDFADNGDGTLTVVRCIDHQADDLDIQFEAGICDVTAIGPRAFEGCTELRRVILPQSLQQIGEMAFSGCTHLRQVTIPGAVQRVGTLAFAKCTQLEHVRIEPGVHQLGPSSFSKCTALRRVDMPVSVVQFGGGVFFGCNRQLSLYGAAGSAAQRYARMNGLTFDADSWKNDEELLLQEERDGTLTVVGLRDPNARRVEIPSELCGRRIAAIAPKAFFASASLEQLLVGGGVRHIGESACFGCRQLISVSFERGLERIEDSAFAGCESLTQVVLPTGTTEVARMAFFGCTRLGFVKMPATTRVADFAFDGCAAGLHVFGGVYAGRLGGLPMEERG